MSRRQWRDAEKGQVYCVDWPEWHADCAHPSCGESVILSGLGEASNAREAAQRFKKEGTRGWVRRKGLWLCPEHAKEAGK